MFVLPPSVSLAATHDPRVNRLADDLDERVDALFEDVQNAPSGEFFFSGTTPPELLDEARRAIYVQTTGFTAGFRHMAGATAEKMFFHSPLAAKGLKVYVDREVRAAHLSKADARVLGGTHGTIAPITERAIETMSRLGAEWEPFAAVGALYTIGTVRPRMAAMFLSSEGRRGRAFVATAYARAIADTEIERAVEIHRVLKFLLEENPNAAEAIVRGVEIISEVWPLPFLEYGQATASGHR